MIQPFHPVLSPLTPPPAAAPSPTNPQWEATKAKMAMLNLSEPEIIAALWRLPIKQRELFFRTVIGDDTHVGWAVPFHEQAPLQLPYLDRMSRSIAMREELSRRSFAATLALALACTVTAVCMGALVWGIIHS